MIEIQFVTDVMLDIIWAAHPFLPVEMHMSGVNSILIDHDSGRVGPYIYYRGARVYPSLESDGEVIIREHRDSSSFTYEGHLETGRLQWHDQDLLGSPGDVRR